MLLLLGQSSNSERSTRDTQSKYGVRIPVSPQRRSINEPLSINLGLAGIRVRFLGEEETNVYGFLGLIDGSEEVGLGICEGRRSHVRYLQLIVLIPIIPRAQGNSNQDERGTMRHTHRHITLEAVNSATEQETPRA